VTLTIAMGITPADDNTQGLPEGWVLTTLRDACEINPSKASKDSLPADAPVTFVPMPAVDAEEGAITKPQTRTFSEVRKGFTSFRENDVIMAKITPCMENGKAAIARNLINGLGFGSTEFHVFRSTGAALPEFVYHFIRQESYRRAAEAEMTGSVGQKRVPQTFFETTELPLPPLPEQVRIVKCLTELLNTVKASHEKLSRVAAILKRFRQGVLAAACSGRLTEDFPRNLDTHAMDSKSGLPDEELPRIADSWRWVRIGDVGKVKGGKRLPKGQPLVSDNTGYPYIRAGNLKDGTVTGEILFLTPAIQKKIARYTVKSGDAYITIVGACIGDAGTIPDEFDGANLTENAAKITELTRVRSSYLAIVLRSPFLQDRILDRIHSASQGKLALHRIAALPIPLPVLEEQEEIICRVNKLFRLADTIEHRVARTGTLADKLTQSILAKAFRGELVPTEAELARREGREYEPASVLLERIRRARADTTDSPSKLKRKPRKPIAPV
jgi:type I restriction enzyme S subunit